jgi:predicted DNA-binding transcriptional regulator YafY
MRSARALDQDRRAFPFDLATYESTKDPFDPSLPRKVKLAILFDRAAPLYPAERPFSDDQRLTRHDARRDRLEATVPNTRYLVAWLRGYGPRVEVLEPEALRSLFATEAAAAHTMYGRRARRRGGAPSS